MNVIVKVSLMLLFAILLTGFTSAGKWDFNPGQEAVKHKNNITGDVAGHGYVREYTKVNTNNLSMLEYFHGSGTMDFADMLKDEQKTTLIGSSMYWIDYTTEDWMKGYGGASSAIKYTRQYDNVQSPTSFAFGTGWYASHPVSYNSLLKDKNEARSYQESASMHRQVEYARAIKGDISVDINCTAPTATKSGMGLIGMKIDDEITEGTLHIGEFMALPMKNSNTAKYGLKQGWKNAIIETDVDYIGDFHVQKTMELEASKSAPTWATDWLPCCSGGFFDVLNADTEHESQKGIFDCTCRNTSISTMKPKWNTSLAQFPTTKYKNAP